MRNAPGFWWSLISAIIAIAAGVVLLYQPITGTLSLTFVLIAFFVIEGIVTIMYAIDHRAQLSGRWGWMLASGIVDLILAGIIFAGLPGTAAWALGLLVGINMVFGGTAMIGMALAAKEPALNIVIAQAANAVTAPKCAADPDRPRLRDEQSRISGAALRSLRRVRETTAHSAGCCTTRVLSTPLAISAIRAPRPGSRAR